MAEYTWGAGGAYTFAANSILSGCRIVNAGTFDDVALNWVEHISDANTIGLWHFNEAVWSGAAGEVIDSGPNGYHGTIGGNAVIADGWLSREGVFDGTSDLIDTSMTFPDSFTVEAWVVKSGSGTYYRPISCANPADGSVYPWFLGIDSLGKWYAQVNRSGGAGSITGAVGTVGAQYHVALTYDAVTDVMTLWVNGASAGVGSVGGNVIAASGHRIGDYRTGGRSWNGRIDEVRVSDSVRYTSAFTPTRYPSSGTVDLIHARPIQQSLIGIAWSSTVGAGYGSVYRVYVNTGTTGSPVWTQVGEDNPTSPITGLSYLVPSKCVRFELTPKNDATYSETPVLLTTTLSLYDSYITRVVEFSGYDSHNIANELLYTGEARPSVDNAVELWGDGGSFSSDVIANCGGGSIIVPF